MASTEPTIDSLEALARERFDVLVELPDTNGLLTEFDHAYEFQVEGGESFFVSIQGGEITVASDVDIDPETAVSWDRQLATSTISGDAKTIEAILAGVTTIVDEAWEGNVEAYVYGPYMHYTSWISRLLKRIRESE